MASKTTTWSQIQLGKVLSYVDQLVELDDETEYTTITVKRNHGGLEEREKIFGFQIRTKKQFKLVPGAFIISRVQCWHQAYAIVPDTVPPNMIASTNYDQFIISPEVDSRFFWWFSHSPIFTEVVRSCAFGVVIEKMVFNRDKWLQQTIPLPSLEEQRRIVARIEELAGRIEEARGLRREAVEEAEVLLSEAVAGILDDKQWTSLTLGSLLRENSRNGLSAFPSDTPLGVPILRISAATSRQDAIIDEQDYKYIELDERDVIKYKVEPGDLLACRFNGNLRYVGKFALYKGYSGKTQVYPDKLIRFRLDTEKASPEFVRYAVNSPMVRKSIETFCATTAGNIGISATDLKKITIPVPPTAEQKRIASYLDDLQSKVNSLKQLQSETSAELDALLPSILDKAFKGEL